METICTLRVYQRLEDAPGYSIEVATPHRFDKTLRFFQVIRSANIYAPTRALLEWHAKRP